ncbi:MAG: MvaI/BcnI family restriction endonuclease [Candidatus Micrarchaeaceae archaeon]
MHEISNEWIPSHRAHDTGVGKTLEDLLGIKENNLPGPNGELVELKSVRKNSDSMISLFTKAPSPKDAVKRLLKRYGYPSEKDPTKLNLHVDLYGNKKTNIRGVPSLTLTTTKSEVQISDINGTVYGGWDNEVLRNRFEAKLYRVLLVKAENKFEDGKEWFKYDEAWVLMGFSFERFIKLIQEGVVKVELRIGVYPQGHPQAGQPHDHGTGFRVLEKNVQDCFAYRDKIL